MTETMGTLRRTRYCGEFRKNHAGETAVVCGWAQRQRDLGSLIFIDLRDRTGLVQLAFDEKTPRDLFDKAFAVRAEWVLMAKGSVRARSSVNPELLTGDVEIEVTELKILNQSETPPFEILADTNAKEELRLRYRYLDLRRPPLQEMLFLRHRLCKLARDYFDNEGFMEIETPILIKSTPEGARDYLVPSRVQKHSFFALPQSPQLY
ncbi:MAG: Asp-tRNA(Asn)/Glu-tRNA(Gln) amidotransferase GatCAB subunit C, partial [Oscillospiraceae bacterium]|nr:Asp-tRNA(Asn)/Glu-tRNA(Gln) amidotransferase GatCAB subunit C [Oscillospiraceae bacterium]